MTTDAAASAIGDVIAEHAETITEDVAAGPPMLGRWVLVVEWIDDDGTSHPVNSLIAPSRMAAWEKHGLLGWGQEMITGVWTDE